MSKKVVFEQTESLVVFYICMFTLVSIFVVSLAYYGHAPGVALGIFFVYKSLFVFFKIIETIVPLSDDCIL